MKSNVFPCIQTYRFESLHLHHQTLLQQEHELSSVFPTPVGPRKTNDPIGRFGSFKPARARRTAFEIALTASSCPITRE